MNGAFSSKISSNTTSPNSRNACTYFITDGYV